MPTPAIVVKDLHKRFHSLEVLKGISLEANEHDVVSILGSSGSGKSTFLRCINLLETPDQGQVYVHGELIRMRKGKNGSMEPVSRKDVERIRSRLGMVFQGFNLWEHMTVLQNVVLPQTAVLKIPKAEAHDRAEHYLEKVGIVEKKGEYPSSLSGGQQQRAAIARALAMEPSVMLFDEPTSALDPELVNEVLSVIQALASEGRTMLIVTHEVGFARDVSSQVMFMHQGQVEEFGPPEEVLSNPDSTRLKQFLEPGWNKNPG